MPGAHFSTANLLFPRSIAFSAPAPGLDMGPAKAGTSVELFPLREGGAGAVSAAVTLGKSAAA